MRGIATARAELEVRMKCNRTIWLFAGLGLMGLAACAPSHESILTGYLYQPPVDFNRFPLQIVAVDGSSRLDNKYRVEPGMHTLTLSSLQSLRRNVVVREQTVEFDVQPCKYYYLAAQHENRILDRWQMVIDYVDDIAGCKYAPGKNSATAVVTSIAEVRN